MSMTLLKIDRATLDHYAEQLFSENNYLFLIQNW